MTVLSVFVQLSELLRPRIQIFVRLTVGVADGRPEERVIQLERFAKFEKVWG